MCSAFCVNQVFIWLLVKQLGGPTWWPTIPMVFVTPALDLRPPSPVRLRMSAVELSLVVPVKDEEEAIGPCLARVIPVLETLDDPAAQSFEILFVDDGSSDTTLEVIRKANAADPRIRAISLSRNFGKEAALSAGLDAARGLAVVPLDVDLQDPPEALPTMIAKWREGYRRRLRRARQSRDRQPAQAAHRRPLLSRPQLAERATRSPNMPAISACSTARWSTSSARCPSATAS